MSPRFFLVPERAAGIAPQGGGGVLGVPRASQSPYPIMVYSVANYRPHLSYFRANMSFSLSQLSHFLFLRIDPFFRLNEEHFTFQLQYKHSGKFANRKYEKLSYPQKIRKCATPF